MNALVLLLWATVVHCASLGHEPQCSKFHYEEQLLEKMIRMEVKVEDVEKSILDTNKKVIEVLGDMMKERQNINKEYEDLKERYSKDMEEKITNISNLEGSPVLPILETDENLNEKECGNISGTATVKKHSLPTKDRVIVYFIEKLLPKTIAFLARGPVDKSLDTGQVIVFAETMFSYGDAYDNITGIFVPPVEGTYLFTIQLCIQNKKYMHYGIMVNNEVQTSGTFYDSDAYQCYSADAILVLKGWERVYVKCLSGTSEDTLYEYSSATYNYWNTFSGVLIHI